jgi:ribosomal protein S18 acetylase RimI-like enzyme
MNPDIRKAKPDDLSAIVALVNRAYRPVGESKGWTHESDIVDGVRVTEEQVCALFVPDSFVFVAEQDSQLLACVHLQMEKGCAHIGMLATNPDLQAKGYGKTMLAYAERYALENFSARQFEMVVISERVELVAFYLRRGYQKTGRVDGYPVSAGVGIPKVQGLTIEVLQKLS